MNIVGRLVLGAVTSVAAPIFCARADVIKQVIEIDGRQTSVITVLSDIRIGDSEKLARLLRRHKITTLQMDSPGGDGIEGMAIARLVHDNRLRVYVPGGCWSACAFAPLVALGAGRLTVSSYANLGLHQAFSKKDKSADINWTAGSANLLARWGAPAAPLDMMVTTKPGEITKLYADDLEDMGASVIREKWSWWW